MDDECRHLLPPDQCDLCRTPPTGVRLHGYRTRGGRAFHNDPDCPQLLRGQRGARAQDQTVHAVEPTTWTEITPGEREPCEFCCTPQWLDRHRSVHRPESAMPTTGKPCEVKVGQAWVPGSLTWESARRDDGLWWATVVRRHQGAQVIEDRNELKIRRPAEAS